MNYASPKTRNELARLFHGECAELGVAKGAFSDTILGVAPRVTRLYSIDRWTDHHDMQEYWTALQTLGTYGRRSVVLRATFDEAAILFPKEYFSAVFVDSYAHLGTLDLLRAWYPKLKPGGLFAVHDFHPDFPAQIEAITAFASENNLTMSLTDEEKYPTFWTHKPL